MNQGKKVHLVTLSMARKKRKKKDRKVVLWPWEKEGPFVPGDGVYCDGGIAGANPSKIGGSWAHCTVYGGEIVAYSSGVMTPEEAMMPHITNNFTELLAAVRALQECPDGWKGILYTDSKCTYLRVAQTPSQAKLNNVPDWLCEQLFEVKRRLGNYKLCLVAGHPNKEDLSRGFNKNGHAVSKHNVWCDERCAHEISQAFGFK